MKLTEERNGIDPLKDVDNLGCASIGGSHNVAFEPDEGAVDTRNIEDRINESRSHDAGDHAVKGSPQCGEIGCRAASPEQVEGETTVVLKSGNLFTRHLGIWFTLMSAVLMSFASMSAAYLARTVGPNQITFSRMYIQLLLILPVSTYLNAPYRFSRNAYLFLLLRSILGCANTSLIYLTFQLMPVANAKSIQYSSPIFAGILGWMILKESYSIVDFALAILTLGGVILIAQPSFIFGSVEVIEPVTSSNVLGSVLSFVSAFLTAIILIIMRHLGSYGMSSLTMVTVYSLVGVAFTAALTSAFNQWALPGCELDRIFIIANGLFNLMCQILVYLAVKTERVAVVAVVHSTDVLFSFVLEYFFYGVVPNYVTIIGASVIIGSFVGVTVKKLKLDDQHLESTDQGTVMEEEVDITSGEENQT